LNENTKTSQLLADTIKTTTFSSHLAHQTDKYSDIYLYKIEFYEN